MCLDIVYTVVYLMDMKQTTTRESEMDEQRFNELMEQAKREGEIRKAEQQERIRKIFGECGATKHGFDGGTYTIPQD